MDELAEDARDSYGGRISAERRDLANIALQAIAVGRSIEGFSRLIDRVPSPRRSVEILDACDAIARFRYKIKVTEMALRGVALEPMADKRTRRGGVLARLWIWVFGE